jgi:uncharacterized protein (DUF952 family)
VLVSHLYHLALRAEWDEALADGTYRRSTLGRSLDEEGFIHCSFAEQVQSIADLVYRGRDDVVLLEIDPERVGAEIKVEQVGGATDAFPHIYGPLPLDAVVSVRELQCGPDGRLDTH